MPGVVMTMSGTLGSSWSQHSSNTILRYLSGTFFTPKVGDLKLHIF